MTPTSPRSALVTGGAGFIGGHLVERLLAENWSVRVLDDFSSGREANLAGCLDRATLLRGDVRDQDVVSRAVEGVDVAFHLAAIPGVQQSVAEPLRTHRVNVEGTLTVLEAARLGGVRRVVYAASAAVYDDSPALPKTESMEPGPVSPYGVQKLTGERYCGLYHDLHGLETVSLRYFNIFGPRQDPRSEYAAVIPRFVSAAIAGEPAVIYGDGEQTRDFTFVSDAVAANLLAADAEGAAGQVMNIAGGHQTSLNRLWEMICDLVGIALDARHDPPRTGDVRDSLACVARAADVMGYESSVELREGLRQTIGSFRKCAESGKG
ncbi:MAG: SDR family oxidoreductase [Myxococcota bacterium]